MGILAEVLAAVNNGAKLEDVIPEGASLAYWQQVVENAKRGKSKRKTTKRRTGSTGKRKRSTRPTLESACNWAIVETVKRVNGDGDA